MTSLFKECGILLVHPGAQIVDVPVGNRRQPLKARIAKHLVLASENLALDSSPEPWAPYFPRGALDRSLAVKKQVEKILEL